MKKESVQKGAVNRVFKDESSYWDVTCFYLATMPGAKAAERRKCASK